MTREWGRYEDKIYKREHYPDEFKIFYTLNLIGKGKGITPSNAIKPQLTAAHRQKIEIKINQAEEHLIVDKNQRQMIHSSTTWGMDEEKRNEKER